MRKRGKIRACSYIVALVAVLSAMNIKYYVERQKARETLAYTYSRSVEDLATSVDNIKNELNKGMYASDDGMLSKLANKMWTHSSAAKACLSQLPIEELNLENTYKFLSQVGSYAVNLSEKCADGEEISEEEYANLKSLFQYGSELSERMWSLEQELQMGLVDFSGIKNENSDVVTVDSGFEDFEDSFADYPTLIYDGPYSDHILSREPRMIKNVETVSKDDALEKAKRVTGSDTLKDNGDEGGKMPSYTFVDGYNIISVTKNGGYLSYMIKDRSVDSSGLSNADAQRIATEYLASLGIENMKMTYYETVYNTCTINFAGSQNGVTLYTDLIKVSVALDNGEILGFDARGYITNHTERSFNKAEISATEAEKRLSPLLNVQSVSEAVVPTDGENEVLCYEFACTNENGENILVYVNQQTGDEEQILMLLISDSGVLTV